MKAPFSSKKKKKNSDLDDAREPQVPTHGNIGKGLSISASEAVQFHRTPCVFVRVCLLELYPCRQLYP